jgi:hypothetical protein
MNNKWLTACLILVLTAIWITAISTPASLQPCGSGDRTGNGPFASIIYTAPSESLLLAFDNGYVYEYHHVPRYVYRAFAASTRKGAFYNDHIRGRYPVSRCTAMDH